MTDVEALEAARDELRDLANRSMALSGAYPGRRPRTEHLRETLASLDRMIREKHEAYG